jgi:anti-sigma factor RsiW
VGKQIRDHSLDTLLDLDGQVFVVDPNGEHWVKFVVKRVDTTPEQPHGLRYSLALHAGSGERLVGFDNAHPVQPTAGPAGKSRKRRDHKHRLRTIRPYDYKDAATLLANFWDEVDAVLKERGVIS